MKYKWVTDFESVLCCLVILATLFLLLFTLNKNAFFFCMKRRMLDIPSVDLANSKAIVCEVERATEFGNLQHCLVRFGDLAVGHMMPLNSFTLTSFHIADIFFCKKF